MNQEKLTTVIKKYKNHISNSNEIEDINERNERMEYYQSWTKERIINMSSDEFVEYIGKLWSMIVWGNKKYIADKIIEINGFDMVKKYLIDLLYGNNDIEKRWDDFYKNIKQIGERWKYGEKI